MSQIKEIEFDEKFITFLKNYTVNAINNCDNKKNKSHGSSGIGSAAANMVGKIFKGGKSGKGQSASQQDAKNSIDTSKYYNLNIFWNLLID